MGGVIGQWVTSGGILIVLALMLINSCGVPFPSEVIMPVAGVLAATGHFNIVAVIVAGIGGNLIGALIAYALARRFGRPLLLGPGKRIGISASHLDLADRWFDRYGLPTVFFGRMLPVICTYISFPAGLAKVQPVWFAVLSLAGSTVWVTFLGVLGYEVGANYTKVSGPISKIAIAFAVLIAIAVVVWYIRGRRRAASRSNAGA
ncbi:MAG TPA: DedA family protein [Candidatus Dormibacteraeota bacterium]